MSDVSTRLDLPFIAPSQAQKHVTYNEAVQRLDLLVQMALDGFAATEPPAAPEPGARYALGLGAMGAWAGQDGQIALFVGEGWIFVAPQEGWLATERGTDRLRLYRDGDWHSFPGQLDMLGIAAEADSVNRLSVAAEATLLNHAGAGHQLKINKSTATATASLLFQTGFAGRAEMGISGQDDFSIKVSANGTAWTEALHVNAQTGHLSGAAVQSGPTDTTAGRLMAVGAFGLGSNATPTNLADINATSTPSGFHRIVNTATGTFPAGAPLFGVMQVERYGPTDIVQTYKPISADALYTRRYTGGAWQAWRQVYSQNSILGTVSQSGGVPTGAVIERGSNANGRYVRFADGTQICTHKMAALTGGDTTWTYPASFATAVSSPHVTVNPKSGGARFGTVGTGTVGNSITFNAWDLTGARVGNACDLTAIGRWF